MIVKSKLSQALLAALAIGCLVPAAVAAKTVWTLTGHGWGHGIGMSQYGAYGLAKHGDNYRQILGRYYQNTRLERRTGTVRVLLQPNRSTISFRGVSKAGNLALKPGTTYRARRSGSQVILSDGSRKVATANGLLRVSGSGPVRLFGSADNGLSNGAYRGAIEIRTAGGSGLNAINAVELEDYVKGVIPNESPPSWPASALQAQAVAARSYSLASAVGGRGFNQYADTRSQVYRGASSETRATNAAATRTSGEILTHRGKVAVTYFFSTSGGHTENVENVFLGSDPKPWLKGIEDPYDNASPYHSWGPTRYTSSELRSKLGNLVNGSFRGLQVIKRGSSPRIVKARIIGSRGTTVVTGPQLKARLGLRDTWFSIRKR